MKVFLTGATGALGHYLLPALLEAGHEVDALARSGAKAEAVETAGARAIRADLFDRAAMAEAVRGKDVVLNMATQVPPLTKAWRPGAWDTHNRIRREGSAILVDAALAAGVARYVQESITFTYPDCGSEWIDESTAITPTPFTQATLDGEASAERFTAAGGTGIALRFGLFYGPSSVHTNLFVRAARWHVGITAGKPGAYVSSIHLEDAASAVVAALAVPPGVYNVVDDEPLTKREMANAVGAAVGRRPWFLYPGRLANLMGTGVATQVSSQRVSNAKFRGVSAWNPKYPSARQGYQAVVAAPRATQEAASV